MMDYESGALEKPDDTGPGKAGIVRRWLLELKLADKREAEWRKKGEKVMNRYRQKEVKRHSFNILWSNTETMRPAIYNSLPKPDVRRRYQDADPIGKAVSEVLARCLVYSTDTTDFDAHIRASVIDMLLPGRGLARVRYVPNFQPMQEATESEPMAEEAMEGEDEELAWEQVVIEHVQWDDFRLSAGDDWGAITWEAFRHRLTREELEERFGELGSLVPLDKTNDQDVESEKDTEVADAFKTAEVWEIWHKENKEVLFIAPGYKEAPLLTLPDPLNLSGFWPNPRPLYACEDSGSMIPTPLFEYYKEQADELDSVTRRINILVKGLKMRGIYDSTLSELSELMRGEDNDLIPASNVTALLERGGLEKAIWFMPIEQAAKVLQILQVQRENSKQVIYEITGISDILRGSTNPNETLGAQQIKSQWGSARLKRMQTDCANFIRDLLRLQAEIIGERFQPETMMEMTGLKFPSAQENQRSMMQWQQQAQMAQMQGQQPPPQPQLPPSWDDIIGILRSDKQRTFKIDVETDSTVAASVETDMAGMKDVLMTLSQVIQGFVPAVQMGAMPVEAMKEIMLAITRRAKMGNAVEDAIDKIKQPPPPPAQQQPADHSLEIKQLELQHSQQVEAGRSQIEQIKLQNAQQLEQLRGQQALELERIKQQFAVQAEQFKQQAETERAQMKARIDAETKLQIAGMNAQAAEKPAVNMDTGGIVEQVKSGQEQSNQNVMQALEHFGKIAESIVNTMGEMNKPKKRVLQRDPISGRATGMIEVTE
jgi:hypothetical protein